MRFDSPCKEMTRDAARLPENVNVKLFLRHAIRYDNPVNGDYSVLFGLKTGLHGENWCRFTEGLFFTGERDDFTGYWRGEKKRFLNW